LNEDRRQLPRLYPRGAEKNPGFYLNGVHATAEFAVLAMDFMPCLDIFGKGGQFLPRYSYVTSSAPKNPAQGDLLVASEEMYTKVDNITDATLSDYRASYGQDVDKDDVFFYVYGLLHSPEYRERFASDLKRMLPRIPKAAGIDRFRRFVEAGRELTELHIGYEDVVPYPLIEYPTGLVPETDEYAKYAVSKMKYGGKAGAWDKSRIIYNTRVTLEGIPLDAHRYMLGSRSAIDWILERYQIKTDKASGIVNDPNDWSREHERPRYIIELVGRIVTVSVETMRIVDSLPSLELPGT
jgi:predicted helicase